MSLHLLSTQLEAQTARVNDMTNTFQLLLQITADAPPLGKSKQLPSPAAISHPPVSAGVAVATQYTGQVVNMESGSLPHQDVKSGASAESASMPDQDTAALVLSHMRQLVDTCRAQDAELDTLSTGLKTHLAEAAAASELMHAAMQQAALGSTVNDIEPEPSSNSVNTDGSESTHGAGYDSSEQLHVDTQEPQCSVERNSIAGQVVVDSSNDKSATIAVSCSSSQHASQHLQGSMQDSLRQTDLRQTAQTAAQHICRLSTRLRQNDSIMKHLTEELQKTGQQSAESDMHVSKLSRQLKQTEQSLQQVSCVYVYDDSVDSVANRLLGIY